MDRSYKNQLEEVEDLYGNILSNNTCVANRLKCYILRKQTVRSERSNTAPSSKRGGAFPNPNLPLFPDAITATKGKWDLIFCWSCNRGNKDLLQGAKWQALLQDQVFQGLQEGRREMLGLPRDILLDIFSRVPTTSVLQLKLVCRAWRDLAQEPILAHMHFQRRAEDDPSFVFCDNGNLYYVESLDCSKARLPVKKLSVPTNVNWQVVGSSAGLLCLCDTSSKSRVAIYNPFTSTYLQLPEFNPFWDRAALFGFGFLPKTKEYKVAKINFSWQPQPSPSRRGFRGHMRMRQRLDVEILTVGSSKWRSLGEVPCNLSAGQSQVLVNGKLHWLTRPCHREPGCRIISFDLSEEQLGEMSKPPGSGWSCSSLTTLGGCLSAIGGDSWIYEVWVLKNYSAMESWVMQYSITLWPSEVERPLAEHPGINIIRLLSSGSRMRSQRPLCVLRTGEVILQYDGRLLVSYDEKSGTCKDLELEGLPESFDTTVHVSSLYVI